MIEFKVERESLQTEHCEKRYIRLWIVAFIMGLVFWGLVFLPGGIAAEVKVFTLVEKTRAADLILIGGVAELRTASIVLNVSKVLKGISISPQIEVVWDRKGTVELLPAQHEVGDEILLFANPKGNLYEPFAGSQGTLKLQPGWADQYQAVIQKILDFDASQAADAKKTVLIDMLKMKNQLAQLSALEIIYLEFHTNTFPTAPLIQPTLELAQGLDTQVAVNAIQVLSRIGDKSVIPVLIQLLGSPNSHVAETVSRVLKGMTRAEIEFDSRQSPEVRAKAIQKWQEWWEQNKDKVMLVK